MENEYIQEAIEVLEENIKTVEQIICSNETSLISAATASRFVKMFKQAKTKLASNETEIATKILLIDKLNQIYFMIPDIKNGII